MEKISKGILTILLVSGLFAFGYKERMENDSPETCLYFTGFTGEVEIAVDQAPLGPGKQVASYSRYKIQPGEHLVEVKHKGRTIVRRQVFISDGDAKEIQIPEP